MPRGEHGGLGRPMARRIRRAVALVVMLTSVGAYLEIGFGLAREGKVHHESIGQVLAQEEVHGPLGLVPHRPDLSLSGSPGLSALRHARGLDLRSTDISSTHRSESQREDGTCMDHCTHLHGAAVLARVVIPFRTREMEFPHHPRIHLPLQREASGFYRPPRA